MNPNNKFKFSSSIKAARAEVNNAYGISVSYTSPARKEHVHGSPNGATLRNPIRPKTPADTARRLFSGGGKDKNYGPRPTTAYSIGRDSLLSTLKRDDGIEPNTSDIWKNDEKEYSIPENTRTIPYRFKTKRGTSRSSHDTGDSRNAPISRVMRSGSFEEAHNEMRLNKSNRSVVVKLGHDGKISKVMQRSPSLPTKRPPFYGRLQSMEENREEEGIKVGGELNDGVRQRVAPPRYPKTNKLPPKTTKRTQETEQDIWVKIKKECSSLISSTGSDQSTTDTNSLSLLTSLNSLLRGCNYLHGWGEEEGRGEEEGKEREKEGEDEHTIQSQMFLQENTPQQKQKYILAHLFTLYNDALSATLKLRLCYISICLVVRVEGLCVGKGIDYDMSETLLEVLKILFKMSKNSTNDILYRSGGIIPKIISILSLTDFVALSSEILVFCLGIAKNICASDKANQKILVQCGAIKHCTNILTTGSMTMHDIDELGPKADGKNDETQSGMEIDQDTNFMVQIYVQCLGLLRHLCQTKSHREQMINEGTVEAVSALLTKQHEHYELTYTILRILSKLTMYSTPRHIFESYGLNEDNAYGDQLLISDISSDCALFSLVKTMDNFSVYPDIVIRGAFVLGSVCGGGSEFEAGENQTDTQCAAFARRFLVKCGAIRSLLNILSIYYNNVVFMSGYGGVGVDEKGSSKNCTEPNPEHIHCKNIGQCVEVINKVLRAIGNICMCEEGGVEAVMFVLIETIWKLLSMYTNPNHTTNTTTTPNTTEIVNEETLLYIVATTSNLSYFGQETRNPIANRLTLHRSQLTLNLLPLLLHSNTDIVCQTVRTLANLSRFDDCKSVLIDSDSRGLGLRLVCMLLDYDVSGSEYMSIVIPACGVLLNVLYECGEEMGVSIGVVLGGIGVFDRFLAILGVCFCVGGGERGEGEEGRGEEINAQLAQLMLQTLYNMFACRSVVEFSVNNEAISRAIELLSVIMGMEEVSSDDSMKKLVTDVHMLMRNYEGLVDRKSDETVPLQDNTIEYLLSLDDS